MDTVLLTAHCLRKEFTRPSSDQGKFKWSKRGCFENISKLHLLLKIYLIKPDCLPSIQKTSDLAYLKCSRSHACICGKSLQATMRRFYFCKRWGVQFCDILMDAIAKTFHEDKKLSLIPQLGRGHNLHGFVEW